MTLPRSNIPNPMIPQIIGWKLDLISTNGITMPHYCMQGNDEAESSRAYQNVSAEENPSEEESYHNNNSVSENPESLVLYYPYIFPEPVYHGPFETYFQAPLEYQNAYNDIMIGLRDPPPKYGYEHSMPSSPIKCLDRSLRQPDEINMEKIMDKARTQFYGQQVYEYGENLIILGKDLMKN
ncbi:hypothetical protein L1987_48183 [Smallanthus sonchifolius]|uniref:Uncharacterized protein n=1 Tax=Smallanthus sonchifolius TaxID=185202 RepID=A0ACB9FRW9_9ASTR|nr:hypothetical protein L1987_48183 [Smallanthus sonchifolius]